MAQAGGGKPLLTGGVSSIDGACRRRLTPWAPDRQLCRRGRMGATALSAGPARPTMASLVTGAALAWRTGWSSPSPGKTSTWLTTWPRWACAAPHLKQTIVAAKLRIAGEAALTLIDTDAASRAGPSQARDAAARTRLLTGALGAKRDGVVTCTPAPPSSFPWRQACW